MAPRSISPLGATFSPKRSTSLSRTSPVVSSSCTTESVESVAAPTRSSALRASDLPAAIPPVSPTNGTRASPAIRLLGLVGRLGLGRRRGRRRRGVLGGRLVRGGVLGHGLGSSLGRRSEEHT